MTTSTVAAATATTAAGTDTTTPAAKFHGTTLFESMSDHCANQTAPKDFKRLEIQGKPLLPEKHL